MLRLFEAYILDALGRLDGDWKRRITGLTPRLAETYASPADTWQGVVIDALGLTPELDAAVRADWERLVGRVPDYDPVQFAREVADSFAQRDGVDLRTDPHDSSALV
jgi:hypothetical protein